MVDKNNFIDGKVSDLEPFHKNNITKTQNKRNNSLFLYFAVFTGSLSFFGGGICIVWTSPVIPILKSNNTEINPLSYSISSYEVSLMMALFSIGNIGALLFGGTLVDSIGRRNTLFSMGILNGVFLLVLSFASDMKWIMIARTINGICVGAFTVALPIFISEITQDHNRGKFGCLMGLFTPLGQLYCYTAGFFFSFKLLTLMCAIPILIGSLPLILFVPETPVQLLHKNDRKAAAISLEKYRGGINISEIEKEMQLMEYTMEQTTKDTNKRWKTLISHQETRRGFIIGLGMFMIQSGCGITVLMSFMGPIFEEAQVGISGNLIAILVGCLKMCTYFFVANIVEKSGRKSLMLISSILCSLALFFLGAYFFMKENNFASYRDYSWFPSSSILFFIFAYAVGLGPVPMATIGELFGVDVRATAFSVITLFGTILGALFSSSFPILKSYIGISGCMWMFSVNCVLGAVFVFLMMPETKGKSIYEIQDMLKEKRNR